MAEDDMPKGATQPDERIPDGYWTLTSLMQFVWAAVQGTSGLPRWAAVHEALLTIEKKLAEANEPSQKDDTQEASTTKE